MGRSEPLRLHAERFGLLVSFPSAMALAKETHSVGSRCAPPSHSTLPQSQHQASVTMLGEGRSPVAGRWDKAPRRGVGGRPRQSGDPDLPVYVAHGVASQRT